MENNIDQKIVIASLKAQIGDWAEQVAMRESIIKKQRDTIQELKNKIDEKQKDSDKKIPVKQSEGK